MERTAKQGEVMTKSTPLVFGFPAWYGRIKARVAKKYLHRYPIHYFVEQHNVFGSLKVGDYINDCSGYNGAITAIEPDYLHISRGEVLYDVDIQTSNTSCSLIHCGIEPELPRQEIILRKMSFIEQWVLGQGGKTWYGNKWEKEAEQARQTLADLQVGGHHTIGSRGERLSSALG